MFLGGFWAESERILAEKREAYLSFLSVLPPLNDTYQDTSEQEFCETMRPATEQLPKLIFYADKLVMMAWGMLQKRYFEAHFELSSSSQALAPSY